MAAKAKWQSVWRNGENNRNKHQCRQMAICGESIMAGENNGAIEMSAKWRINGGEMAKKK
jgi:hypothetical protein